MADEKQDTNESNEADSQENLVWEMFCEAKDDAFEQDRHLLKNPPEIDEDCEPTCATLCAFMDAMQDNHRLEKPKHQKTLPHLLQNYWDAERQELLCMDVEKGIAQMWRKTTLN